MSLLQYRQTTLLYCKLGHVLCCWSTLMSAEAQAAEVPAAAPADVKTVELGAEVTSAESVEVDPKLKKQLEFYFSDSNLPKDKFLLMQTKKTPEGWVSLKVLTVRGLARVSHRAPY